MEMGFSDCWRFEAFFFFFFALMGEKKRCVGLGSGGAGLERMGVRWENNGS